MTISKSPERMTFQSESYAKRLTDPESTEEQKSNALAMLNLWKTWREETELQEANKDWQTNNLEYDLRTCKPMLTKVRASDTYAQNLYAAMCNMQFQKLDVFPILKNERWSCSWRHAGGIIADMRMQGDYIDWYCSGIGNEGLGNGDFNGDKGYVPEGVVTEEIKMDLQELGWIPIEWDEEE
jgi:hypothetical protein